MTFTITKDTDRDDIEKSMRSAVKRESVRTGDSRRQRLQTNVRRQGRIYDTTLDIDVEHPTAHCEAVEDGTYNVVITGREIPQPLTEYEAMDWDWLVQRSFGLHEVGHIRYTDFEDARDQIENRFDAGDKGIAHSLHNALEDGAIEKQLSKRWPNYEAMLRTLRANIFEETDMGIADPERGGYIYPMAHATHAAVMDLWTREVYNLNIGVLDDLKDQSEEDAHFYTDDDYELFIAHILPLCEAIVPTVLSTANAQARNTEIFDFVEAVLPYIEDADADGKSQKQGDSDKQEDGAGYPDDSRDNHSDGAAMDAEQLEAEDDANPSDDDDGPQNAACDSLSDVDEDVDVQARAEVEVGDDVRDESGLSEELLDELEDMAQAMAGDELESEEIQIPTERTEDTDSARRAEEFSKPLARILRNRLQHEQRTKTLRGRRRGRLDSTSLHRTILGERDVKQRRMEPDEKDYNAVVVLDRSGSMTGRRIRSAEPAAAGITLALEEVGVDVAVFDLLTTKVHLAKPFGATTKDDMAQVCHGETGGGTPLTEVLKIARARLNQEGGKRFMVVITDGEIPGADEFEKTVRASTFPVLGVNIGGSDTGSGAYDVFKQATAGEDLGRTLQDLVEEVMF